MCSSGALYIYIYIPIFLCSGCIVCIFIFQLVGLKTKVWSCFKCVVVSLAVRQTNLGHNLIILRLYYLRRTNVYMCYNSYCRVSLHG